MRTIENTNGCVCFKVTRCRPATRESASMPTQILAAARTSEVFVECPGGNSCVDRKAVFQTKPAHEQDHCPVLVAKRDGFGFGQRCGPAAIPMLAGQLGESVIDVTSCRLGFVGGLRVEDSFVIVLVWGWADVGCAHPMNSIVTAGSSVESVTMFGTRHWAGFTGPSQPDRTGSAMANTIGKRSALRSTKIRKWFGGGAEPQRKIGSATAVTCGLFMICPPWASTTSVGSRRSGCPVTD